jgi:hypothetical protein
MGKMKESGGGKKNAQGLMITIETVEKHFLEDWFPG